MKLELGAETAVVTGAARGIGLAIASRFAAEHANVVLIDREPAASRSAAQVQARFGVNCTTIICDVTAGMIQTPRNRAVWQAWYALQSQDDQLSYEQWGADKIARVTPLGRWQDAEDVAAMAVFLASRQARNITCQTINVDGGQVMR